VKEVPAANYTEEPKPKLSPQEDKITRQHPPLKLTAHTTQANRRESGIENIEGFKVGLESCEEPKLIYHRGTEQPENSLAKNHREHYSEEGRASQGPADSDSDSLDLNTTSIHWNEVNGMEVER
jgi:hypothetical protein